MPNPPLVPTGFIPDGFEPDPPAPAQVMVNGQPMSMEDYNQTQQMPPTSLLDTAKDLGAGFAKAAGRTVQFVGDTVPHAFGGAGLSDYVDMATGRPEGTSEQMASEGLQSKNTTQTIGGLGETAAELAFPIGAAAEALPRAGRAAENFKTVMGAAKNVPVDVTAASDVALRIQQLAERGGSMPMAVRKFLKYVTDPSKPPMTYEVARDFASNVSRLSANESMRLTPQVAAKVAEMRIALNAANAQAAKAAGKGAEYASAMNEYARAMRLRDAISEAAAGAKKAAPYAIGAGAAAGGGYWMTKKVVDLLGGN